jgi:uroporphyrinogen-III synthase
VSLSKIRKILFSQNPPINFEKSPYAKIVKDHKTQLDFYKFFQIEGIPINEFSKDISFLDYTAVILTSVNAIDHFLRIAGELQVEMPPLTTKYFCVNPAIASYLQEHTIYRKRKLFYPENGKPEKLMKEIMNHVSDRFLLPSAMDTSLNQLAKLLDAHNINYSKAEVFKPVFTDVSKVIDVHTYDMVVFFSPYGIQTLLNSYPNFKQGKLIIGALGSGVVAAAQKAGLQVQVMAPTPKHLSIFSALDSYLIATNGRKRR